MRQGGWLQQFKVAALKSKYLCIGRSFEELASLVEAAV
jgi:hypothetical protein